MNSMMLAQRLTSKLSVKNLPALVAEDALTIIDAMTGGIKDWFDGLPPRNKQTRYSGLIHAPLSMTINVTDGSKDFTFVSTFPAGGYTSAAELLGKSVTISAAGPMNRLDKALTLLKPWLGASGNVVATFYGDAIGFDSPCIRVVDRPIWEGEGSGRWELLPMEGDFYPVINSWGSVGRAPQSGQPRYFQSGPLNPTLNSAPAWFLRVWPLPNTRGTLTFTLETTPPVLGIDALQVPVAIPIPDEDMPDVIALCEDRLTGTQLWAEKADKQKAYADTARSRDRLARKWIPLDAAPAEIAILANW